jgi:hypothetical protein
MNSLNLGVLWAVSLHGLQFVLITVVTFHFSTEIWSLWDRSPGLQRRQFMTLGDVEPEKMRWKNSLSLEWKVFQVYGYAELESVPWIGNKSEFESFEN